MHVPTVHNFNNIFRAISWIAFADRVLLALVNQCFDNNCPKKVSNTLRETLHQVGLTLGQM